MADHAGVVLLLSWGFSLATGARKMVMTGPATDPLDWRPHIRNKERREKLANRFMDPDDPFRIVIVRDMWLTGFDALSLHTIYVDKPIKDHGLMQAIARANLRRLVRRVLRKHGYPPDTQDAATDLVIAQAELMGAEWAR